MQKEGPNAMAQAQIAETLAAEHVDSWTDELAVSKVQDGGYVVPG